MSKQWPTVMLGEVLEQHDNSVRAEELTEINLAGVYSFARGLFKRRTMSPGETTYKSYNRLVTGDFVISTPKAWEGALARVTSEFDGWFLSPVFPTFRADRNRLMPEFLEWYCRREPVWIELQHKSRGIGARRESVHPKQFLSLHIPLPPLAEQRRVVARIEELAAQIQEARTLRQQAVEEAEALLPRRIVSLFDQGGKKGWQQGVLGDYVTDDCYGTSEKTNDDEAGTPILRMGNIQNGCLDLRDLKYLHLGERDRPKLLLRRGDILVNRTNSAELVGKCAVFDVDGEYGFASYLIRLRLNQDTAEPKLIANYINSPMGRAYMFAERKQMTGQANVNSKKLKSLPIVLPSLPEQRQIVAELDALQVEVDAVKRLQAETAAELDALLPSILDKAFKGEL